MKKKKRALTKQQRNAILQSLQRSNEFNPMANNSPIAREGQAAQNDKSVSDKIYTSQIQTDTNSFIKELKKIAIVGSIIVIILAGTVALNQKTDYLIKAGSFITSKIGL